MTAHTPRRRPDGQWHCAACRAVWDDGDEPAECNKDSGASLPIVASPPLQPRQPARVPWKSGLFQQK